MEKEKYTKAEMEIILFDAEDIITDSSEYGDTGDPEFPTDEN